MIPVIIYLIMAGIRIGVGIVLHGKKVEMPHSFWAVLVRIAVNLTVLYFGHFFDPILK